MLETSPLQTWCLQCAWARCLIPESTEEEWRGLAVAFHVERRQSRETPLSHRRQWRLRRKPAAAGRLRALGSSPTPGCTTKDGCPGPLSRPGHSRAETALTGGRPRVVWVPGVHGLSEGRGSAVLAGPQVSVLPWSAAQAQAL